ETVDLHITQKDLNILRLTQPGCRFHQCTEHGLQIECGATDDLEHLGGRGLLFPSLGEFAPAFFELVFQIGGLPLHSITSSARASRVAGTVRPSALAVLRLMASSYLFGACTGRSAGFAPFNMRLT